MAWPVRRVAARRALWAGALLLTACEPPTAQLEGAAYDATALSGGRRYRWASGSVVRVWVEGGAAAGGADLERAVRAAE
ncbi:MAG: hypothetical protein RLZ32_3019, partial [Gemmatimonadota bacterium]